MNKKEIEQLFQLLAIYRPGDKRLEDKTLKAAWLLVLEPFSPAEVKTAVGAYFRESKYFPDVSDIALLCPKAPPVLQAAEVGRWQGWEANGYQGAEDYQAKMGELITLGRLMDLDYISAGVPHPSEARKLGWTAGDWIERCREVGLC